ncbi:MAG: glycosyltransferase [Myxococcota bacterium]|nr:glycosyltransferase [Myxococcota bacterium]
MSRPVILHVTSFAFGATSHPGVHRCVTGMAAHADNVVLHWGESRYAAEEGDGVAESGVSAYRLEAPKLLKKPFAVSHLLAGVRRRHGSPAAVIAHFGNNGWRALPLAAWADVPLLTLFHGEDAARRVVADEYADAYRRLFAAPGARFRAVAGHLADSLRKAGAPGEATGVHHLGVPIPKEPAAPRTDADGGLRVALVGRLLGVKGHAVAFEAVARARRAGSRVELLCFGEGPERDALEEKRRVLGLSDAIELCGALPAAELERALRAVDAVVQPSVTDPDGRAEGLPNALLEAMALGLPAVGSRHGGIPEAIVHEETGLLVAEGSASELADALVRLAAEPATRRRMGSHARRRAEQEFSHEGQGRRLAVDVDEMIGAYRRIPEPERREAWRASLEGLAEAPEETGRRERLRWMARIAANRLAGAIP